MPGRFLLSNRLLRALAAAGFAASLMGEMASAASIDWDNGAAADSNWNTPGNWLTDIVPVAPDDAVFVNPAAGPALITADVPAVREIRFGDEGRAGSGEVQHSAGTLSATGALRMGIESGSAGTYSLTGGQLNAGRFAISESAGATGNLAFTGGTVRQPDVASFTDQATWNWLGQEGDAALTLSGAASVSFDSRTALGFGAASSALVTQTGGVFEVRRGELTLGYESADTEYKISGGTLRTLHFHADAEPQIKENVGGHITIGERGNSNAKVEVSGTATVSAALNLVVGEGHSGVPGQGLVEQMGGSVFFGSNGFITDINGDIQTRSIGGLQIGTGGGSTGVYNLSGGILRQNSMGNREDQGSWNRIGMSGNATMNISGGEASFDSRVILAGESLGTAVINQTGGIFEVRRHQLIISDLNAASYNISGGTLRTLSPSPDHALIVGNWDNSNGQLNISGTAEVTTAGPLEAGGGRAEFAARGEINQNGGEVTIGGRLALGAGLIVNGVDVSSGNGTYNLSGGLLRQQVSNVEDQGTWNRFAVGASSRAAFNISGGTASFHSRLLVLNGGIYAEVNQTGGVVEVRDGDFTLGDVGTGAAGAPPPEAPNAIYNLSAGTLQTLSSARQFQVGQWERANAEMNISGTGRIISAGDLLVGAGNPDTNTSRTIGVLNQTGGEVQVGGQLLIAAAGGVQGTYNLSGGVLDMTDGNINFGLGTAAFNMTGGRLQNVRSANFAFNQQGGTFAAGTPTPDPFAPNGTVPTTINGAYTLAAPSTLELEITSTTLYDVLNIAGLITLAGNLEVIAAPGLQEGDTFTIVQNFGFDPVAGFFAGKPQGSEFVVDGTYFQIDYFGGFGNDIVLLVVPEPHSALLLATGMCALFARRRRARNSAVAEPSIRGGGSP